MNPALKCIHTKYRVILHNHKSFRLTDLSLKRNSNTEHCFGWLVGYLDIWLVEVGSCYVAKLTLYA